MKTARLSHRALMGKKLLLKCDFSIGDIVMLTAALRDLHQCYPGRFVTAVRTHYPELWEHNPHIGDFQAGDSEVETIECSYPLINGSNHTPHHCLHGFVEFLNQRLGLRITHTAFKGDIHLSELEKSSRCQVHYLAGKDIPFWLVAAGGKYDITLKWWDSGRYQEVIDHFQGKIQFVQVGEYGHYHPRLDGVVDLRGQTSLRDLVRLVYHSQGVLCPVTGLMHLAAAVPTKRGVAPNRACVVIAGGREPAHWEAYPGHQLIHTNGALPCCAKGGCWKQRIERLRDGDPYDKPSSLCVRPVNGLPACMEMITSQEVIRRIELYFVGGALQYLSRIQRKAGDLAAAETKENIYDKQPLILSNAGVTCDQFVRNLARNRDSESAFAGRGIVVCARRDADLDRVRVCIQQVRRLGCRLPVQVWHFGKETGATTLFSEFGVVSIDASRVRRRFPVRSLTGPGLMAYAALYSDFREVLLLEADNVPEEDPGLLFEVPQFQKVAGLFWSAPNQNGNSKAAAIWRSCGLRRPIEPGFGAGRMLLNKQRCWRALRLAVWFNENADFYWKYLGGAGEVFQLAFRKLRLPYCLARSTSCRPGRSRTSPADYIHRESNCRAVYCPV